MKKKSFFEVASTILIVAGSLFFIISLGAFIFHLKTENISPLGDFNSGVVGSLWALAGVFLFYAALKSQQEALSDQKESTKANIDAVKKQTESLELQMKEFELQRKELEDTRKVFQDQSETLSLQRFENTFFSLLKLRSELFQTIYNGSAKARVFGMEAFEKLWFEFSGNSSVLKEPDIKKVCNLFDKFYQVRKNAIDPYFSTLFHILETLNRANIPKKEDYVDLFVAQLSEIDKLFLFYLGAKTSPGNKLKPLLEKYHVLRYLNSDRLIDSSQAEAYSINAYVPPDER